MMKQSVCRFRTDLIRSLTSDSSGHRGSENLSIYYENHGSSYQGQNTKYDFITVKTRESWFCKIQIDNQTNSYGAFIK